MAVGGYYGYNYYQSNKVKTSDNNETSDYANITFDVVSEWNDKYQLSAMYPKRRTQLLINLPKLRSTSMSRPLEN